MLKNGILLFNFVTLFFLNLFFGEDVQVMMSVPNEMAIGQTYRVELTVTKGSISGFAKLQSTLPEGFTAKMVDGQGASFTFNEQRVKFIWMNLPEEDEFTITYDVTVEEGAPPTAQLNGKFSYIEDNNRQTYTIPAQEVTIGTESEAVAEGSEEEAAEPEAATAECSRMITKKGDGQYEVEVTIKKSGIEGFAKIQENIPTSAKASVGNSSDAVFSSLQGRAKFVWMSLPEDEDVKISYTISSDEPIEEELANINGEFSYLDQNQTTKVEVTTSPDSPYGNAGAPATAEESGETEEPETPEESTETELAQAEPETTPEEPEEETTPEPEPETTPEESTQPEETTPEPEPEVTPEPEPEATTPDPEPEPITPEPEPEVTPEPEEIAAEEPEAKVPTKPEPRLTSIPAPEKGITYKVQICAGHKQVGQEHFKKVYNWDQTYSMENHEGWIKYTIGSWPVYRNARDKRVDVTASHNFPGPFVTAYNEGERITVQEALMISNQKWYK